MKLYWILFLWGLCAMGCGSSAQKEVVLIPQPQVCELHSGVYSFSAGEAFYTNLSGDERDDLAAVLASSPFRLVASDDAGAAFHFEMVASLPGISSDEGYTLAVGADGVRAEATTPAGLFYAFQSLLQMAEADGADEAFVLVDGGGVLVVTEFNKDNSPVFVAKKMERNVTYNVPAGTWHNIAMDEDAKILIIEKALTHRNDVEHRPLDKEQRERLTRIIACTI